jgi:putative intracellular protease/amidase
MKTTLVIVLIALNVTLVGQRTQPSLRTSAASSRVLLIARESSFNMEVALKGGEVRMMKSLLEAAGHMVVVASASGNHIIGGSDTLQTDLALSDVHIEDYVAVIIPCMMSTDFDPKTNEPEAVEVVGRAVALGKPIAAQLSAVLILAATGALNGKDFAMHPKYASLIRGGQYQGAGVVQDGNLVTSGTCPMDAAMGGGTDGTPALVQELVALISSAGRKE